MMWFNAVLVSVGMISAEQDTLALSQVEVHAPKIERFAQGQKIEAFSSADLKAYQARSLGDLLQERSPIFVRQYGAGMLASPSFRGTSAGHTAVFWNGLPVNSPSLGQSDLSIFPTLAFDQVQMQYGSSGALFGNEAIGGSIHLSSVPKFNQGFQTELSQQFGSFGLSNTSLNAGFSSKNLSIRSKFYRLDVANDFSFRDLGQPGTPIEKQQNASVNQKGFIQDLAWNLSESQQVKLSYWWNESDRQIQPVIGSNTQDRQLDQNHRLVLDYFHFSSKSRLNLKTGLILDRQRFNSDQNDTDSYFFAGEWDTDLHAAWSLKIGARYTRVHGDLSTYQAVDERLEVYQSIRFIPSERLSLSANLRQVGYYDQALPFVPALGLDWTVRDQKALSILLKASGGRGFKVPTINDRFWEPGGNPELRPEQSWNGEIGLHFSGQKSLSWKGSLTYYYMNVDDWIIWLPQGSFWTPENIRQVQNQGLELDLGLEGKIGAWNWALSGNYAYSRAVSRVDSYREAVKAGQQLPYTPQHQGQVQLSMSHAGLNFGLSGFYVGERLISTDANRAMPSYQLVNASLGYAHFALGKVKMPISFQVNNLFNTDYQVLYLRAMPGISYQLNITISL